MDYADVNGDSTECCPVLALQHLLAVGTYELDEATKYRRGRLYLYALQQQQQQQGEAHIATLDKEQQLKEMELHADEACPPTYTLHQQHTQDVPGILDMKWRAPCLANHLLHASRNTSPVKVKQEAAHTAPQAACSEPNSCISQDQPALMDQAVLGVALADGGLRLYRPRLRHSKEVPQSLTLAELYFFTLYKQSSS